MKANVDGMNDLMARMNAATGQDKVDAMALWINEMVAQLRAMH